MPKVSIVLPNYNYARYLDERIQSLLNQTYQDFELIILDDASTDNSIDVINKYTKYPRIKTQFYIENSGLPYKRWNDGADLAQGKYLLIAGADDSCHPTLLEKLVEKLDMYPSVGLAYSQSWEIDSDSNLTYILKTWTDPLDPERWAKDFINEGKKELKYLFNRNTIPNASTVLMRRQIFIEVGKFDAKLKLAADWKLWANILMISDIAFVAEPLNYFRNHPNTVRNASDKIGLSIEEAYKVQQYILTIIFTCLSKKDINLAWEKRADEWVYFLTKHKNKLSIKRIFFIYLIASDIDKQINKRLIFKLTVYIIREMKITLSRLKQKFIDRV